MSNNNPYNLRAATGAGGNEKVESNNTTNQSSTNEPASEPIIRDGSDPSSVNTQSIHSNTSEIHQLGATLMSIMEDRFKQMQLDFEQRMSAKNSAAGSGTASSSHPHHNISQTDDPQYSRTINIGNNINQQFNPTHTPVNSTVIASTIPITPDSLRSVGSINNNRLNPNQLSFNDPQNHSVHYDSRSSSANQVQSASAVPVYNTVDDKNNKLPGLTNQSYLTTNQYPTAAPEKLISWKLKLMDDVESVPKYRPLLKQPYRESWEQFKLDNPGIKAIQLEPRYIDCQFQLWSRMMDCIDTKLRSIITNEMKAEDQSNIPAQLRFQQQDPEYYKDCYTLLDKLTQRFGFKSQQRLVELIKQQRMIRYNPGSDPETTFNEYISIEQLLTQLVPKYQTSDETILAHRILDVFPDTPDFKFVRQKFSTGGVEISIAELRSTLREWWLSNKSKMSANPKNSKNYYESAVVAQSSHTKFNKTRFKPKPQQQQQKGGLRFLDEPDAAVNNIDHDNEEEEFTSDDHDEHQTFDESEGESSNLVFAEPEEEASVNTTTTSTSESAESDSVNAMISGRVLGPGHALFDSASTINCSGDKERFENRQSDIRLKISTIAGSTWSDSSGTIKLREDLELLNVRYIDKLPHTIMSVAEICDSGSQVLFTNKYCLVLAPGTIKESMIGNKVRMYGKRQGNLYVYYMPSDKPTVARPTGLRVIPGGPPSSNNTTRAAAQSSSSNANRRVKFKEGNKAKSKTQSMPKPLRDAPVANTIQHSVNEIVTTSESSTNIGITESDRME
jgi:hypothetical protein